MSRSEFDTLKDLFDYSTSNYPNNKSFSYIDGISYTYAEFKEKTSLAESILFRYGIKKGDKVALISQNMPNWPVAYFATTINARVIVPLLPDFSSNEIENVIDHSESKAIFISEKLLHKLSKETIQRLMS